MHHFRIDEVSRKLFFLLNYFRIVFIVISLSITRVNVSWMINWKERKKIYAVFAINLIDIRGHSIQPHPNSSVQNILIFFLLKLHQTKNVCLTNAKRRNTFTYINLLVIYQKFNLDVKHNEKFKIKKSNGCLLFHGFKTLLMGVFGVWVKCW